MRNADERNIWGGSVNENEEWYYEQQEKDENKTTIVCMFMENTGFIL